VDELRQLRYLSPATLFVLALVIGARIDGDNAITDLWKATLQTSTQAGTVGPTTTALVALLAGGTAVVLSAGILIGAVARCLLVGIAWVAGLVLCWRDRTTGLKRILFWEVFQQQAYFERIWPLCAPSHGLPEPNPKYYYYSVVTFDHENLFKHAPGLHSWLVRRWTWFNVTFNAAVALLLQLIIGWLWLRIEPTRSWLWALLALMTILLLNAGAAWHQTQRMHEFQSFRP